MNGCIAGVYTLACVRTANMHYIVSTRTHTTTEIIQLIQTKIVYESLLSSNKQSNHNEFTVPDLWLLHCIDTFFYELSTASRWIHFFGSLSLWFNIVIIRIVGVSSRNIKIKHDFHSTKRLKLRRLEFYLFKIGLFTFWFYRHILVYSTPSCAYISLSKPGRINIKYVCVQCTYTCWVNKTKEIMSTVWKMEWCRKRKTISNDQKTFDLMGF